MEPKNHSPSRLQNVKSLQMSESEKLNNVALTKQDEALDGANYECKSLSGESSITCFGHQCWFSASCVSSMDNGTEHER